MRVSLSRTIRLALGALFNLVYFCASLFPRDQALWIFGAWNGKKFLDNPKYVFLHVLKTLPEVRAIWITRSRTLAQELCSQGLPAAYAGSLRGVLAQLRAGVVVFTHSVEWDLWAPLIARRVKRVQTYHGMPIKRIGYDDEKGTSVNHARWIARLFPYRHDRIDLVTAGGSADQACYRTAFNVRQQDVVITGHARNDALIRSMGVDKGRTDPTRDVIYMPTLRGVPGSEFMLFKETGFDFAKSDAECGRLGLRLWIKLHPVQRYREDDMSALSKCTNIYVLTEGEDIYELIGRFDMLITDFSSIYFDFLISGRPIIMAPLDMGGYLARDRSLYYSYEELCPDEPCVSWKQIFQRLVELCKVDVVPSVRYHQLQRRFHGYLDDQSAERTVTSIVRLISKRGLGLPKT